MCCTQSAPHTYLLKPNPDCKSSGKGKVAGKPVCGFQQEGAATTTTYHFTMFYNIQKQTTALCVITGIIATFIKPMKFVHLDDWNDYRINRESNFTVKYFI